MPRLAGISTVSAADYYWDSDGSSSASTGGTGTWDTTSFLWRSGSATGTLLAWPNNTGTPDIAFFGGTAGTVTIADATAITAGGLTFTANYTLDRAGTGSLTLAGASSPVVNVGTSVTATISAGIGGSAGLTKTGSGSLVLSGSNSYSGTTTLTTGALRLANSNALGTSSISVTTVGTDSTRAIELQGGITINNRMTVSSSGIGNLGMLRNISGSNTLTNFSFGNGNGTRIGIEAGSTLRITNNLTDASTGQAKRFVGAGTLILDGSNSAAFLSGTGVNQTVLLGVSGSGGGTVALGNDWALGGSRIQFDANATLRSSSTNARSIANPVLFTGSASQITLGSADTGDLTLSGTLTLSTSGTLAVNNAQTTISGPIVGSGFGFTKSGAGRLTLTVSNSLTGATTVRGGQLEITSTGQINGTSGITINGAGAELKYNSATALTQPITFTQGTLSGTGTIGTAVTVGTSDILSPGNSPGSQSFTSGLTFAPEGKYVWEINNWAGAAVTNYDQLAVSGSALNITATSGTTFTIAVTGLTTGNVSGVVPGFSPGTTGTTFTIATSAAGITGFDKSKFSIDTSAFTNNNTLPTNAGFWLTTNSGSNQLILNYAPSATYNLSANATATAIRVGGTSTITATVTSSTASVANPDSLSYTGLALSGGLGTVSPSGALAGGQSGSGSVVYTGTAGGAFTFNPSVLTATNVNIGSNANAGTSSGVTVSVYNLAAANSISGTVDLGAVLKGTSLSQALTITNTAPTGNYTEKLDAAFGTLTGDASTNAGSVSLLVAGSTSAAMSVGLDSSSAGGKAGSVVVDFTSNGLGTSGLGTTSLASQTVSLTATVLDPALASFTSGSTATTSLLLDFGSVQQNASVSPLGFDLYNLMQTNDYTADLALLMILSGTGNTGAITTTLPGSFNNLAAGSHFAYSASFSTATLGSFQNVYTLQFKSANNGSTFAGDTTQNLTLTVQGVIIVPEPGALAIAAMGVAAAMWTYRRRLKDRSCIAEGGVGLP